MSAPADGGPAFPTHERNMMTGHPDELMAGMTLRDYFAAKASDQDVSLQGETLRVQIAQSNGVGILPDDWRATARYMHADAMLAAREAAKPVEQPAREVLSDDLSKCQRALMGAGKLYPKTCPVCGLGGKCKREGSAA